MQYVHYSFYEALTVIAGTIDDRRGTHALHLLKTVHRKARARTIPWKGGECRKPGRLHAVESRRESKRIWELYNENKR